MPINFKIIIPCYNVEKWIEKCLNSLLIQTYKNWNGIIINDCSTDNTLNIINKVIENKPLQLINTEKKNCPLASIVIGTNAIVKDPEDVIITLDGDDWLYNDNVLNYLNEVYSNTNIWLTYGQYVHASNIKMLGTNAYLTSTSRYRKYRRWRTSHLRTYKNKLWQKLDMKELKNEKNEFYHMAGDMAIMFPLIEMAGLKHIKYIREILYVYNDKNPLNEHNINRDLQEKNEQEIRNKNVLNELENI